MVVARASGMDLASILKRNTFLTLGVRPARGPGSGGPRGTGGQKKGPGTGGHKKGPGTGGHGGPQLMAGNGMPPPTPPTGGVPPMASPCPFRGAPCMGTPPCRAPCKQGGILGRSQRRD